jgi:hypothetical protein
MMSGGVEEFLKRSKGSRWGLLSMTVESWRGRLVGRMRMVWVRVLSKKKPNDDK